MATVDVANVDVNENVMKKIAQKLASNDVRIRNRALKSLKRFLKSISGNYCGSSR